MRILSNTHKNKRFVGVACGFVVATLAVVSPAIADDADGSGDLVAQLLQRVSALEAQQRELRGDVDQLNNLVKTQNEALAKKIDDAQFASRAKDAGGGGARESVADGDDAKPVKPSAPDAAGLVRLGKADLLARNYTVSQHRAEAALKVAQDRATKVAARFLLAQSLAGQKDYKSSAVAYYDAYRTAPHAETAPQSLLGVSAAMLALGRKSDACEALGKLRKDFPQPGPRIKSAYDSFYRRAHCN